MKDLTLTILLSLSLTAALAMCMTTYRPQSAHDTRLGTCTSVATYGDDTDLDVDATCAKGQTVRLRFMTRWATTPYCIMAEPGRDPFDFYSVTPDDITITAFDDSAAHGTWRWNLRCYDTGGSFVIVD